MAIWHEYLYNNRFFLSNRYKIQALAVLERVGISEQAYQRASTVLGIVGAGGIGVSLYQSSQSFDYGKVCAILIILILATAIVDTISAKLRNKLI